jgi:hypothetical protein
MSCILEYNAQNKITGVKDAEGNTSALFNSIISNPHLSVEQSVDLFKNTFTKKFKGEQLPIEYRNNNNEVFQTFKEALDNTTSGDIQGYSGDNLMFSVTSSSNPESLPGFLNSMIKEDVILGETLLDNGQKVIQVSGASETMKAIKSQLFQNSSFSYLGINKVKKLSNGNFIIAEEEEQKELPKDYKTFEEELSSDPMYRPYGDSKVIQDEVELPNEGKLKVQILSLLNKLGIKTMGISEYVSKYTIKNGVEPTAQALIDIANRVIAFQGNQISVEDLTEETAHLIVEGWNSQEIENLLRNIHKTEEWAELSEQYREIYSKNYSGEELETVLRKEILGKVLKNAIQNSFQVENKTETQQNFIEKVRTLFESFFTKVQVLFKPQYVSDLQEFNNQVIQLLQQEELQNYLSNEQLSTSKLTLYSVPNSPKDPMALQVAVARKAIEVLEITQNQLSKVNGISSSKESILRLKRNLDDIDEQNKLASFAGIAASVKNQIKYLNKALKNNDKKKHPFSTEENVVYMTLLNQMRPILSEVGALLEPSNYNDRLIKTEIDEAIIGIQDLYGQVKSIDNYEVLENLVEDLAVKHNWSEESKINYLKVAKAAKKDTNWAHAYFGSLNHAENPLLNLFGENIKKITMQTYRDHANPTTDLLLTLESLGVSQKELNSLRRSSFLIDEVDHQKVEDKVNEIELKAYNQFSGQEPLEIKEYLIKKREGNLPDVPNDKLQEYREEIKDELNQYLERPFKDEYYAKKEALYEQENISLETRKWLSTISSDVASIYQRAKDENGTIILTEDLKFNLEQIAKERAFAKSPYTTDGSYKQGLGGVIDSEGNLEIVIVGNTSEEALRAYELAKLDKIFLEDLKNNKKDAKGIPVKFIQEIEKLESKGDFKGAFDFLKLNSYLGFNREFWDSLGAKESLIERLSNVQGDNQQRAEELIFSIKELQSKRNNIIKGNRVLNQPSETDVERMSKSEKEYIKEYTEKLQLLYQEASTFFKKEASEEDVEETSENTVNQAYRDALKDLGIVGVAELDFIREHTTSNGKADIDSARTFVNMLLKGQLVNIPKKFEKYFRTNYPKDPIQRQIAVEKDLIRYAQTRLLPYYTKFSPAGYDALIQGLNSGNKKVSELLQEVADGQSPLTVTPNYSFFEAEERTDLNEKYVRNYEGGRYQFKGDDFKSADYVNLFEPDENGNPTKNEKLFKARQALLDYHRESLQATDTLNQHNIYKLPQQSKSSLRKLEAFAKQPSFGKIREGIKDTVGYREEDIATGEVIEGSEEFKIENMKIIPKYGFKDLANQDDLSDELLTSYSWMHEQSMLYRARKEHIGQALMLQSSILNDTYIGKQAAATATYKMFQSHMDEAYFGVKEDIDYNINFFKNYNVNVSKLLRIFSTFVRFRNLGFAVISPATSWITAQTQFYLENKVGEHVDMSSTKMANKEFRKLAGAAIAETGEINSKARLNILLENFLVYDKSERLKNSSFGKVMRNMVKLPYATHSMGNFPVIPRIALSVMYDYRIVDGNIQNFNEFKRANPTLSSLELRNTWNANEENAMYKFMLTDDGKFNYDKAKMETLLGRSGEELEKYLKLKNEAIYQRISYAVQNIDGQMPEEEKSISARNLFLQLLTVHRSFIPIATARRFKNKHISLMSGQVEEGSYRTLGRFIKGYFEQFTKDDVKNLGKDIKTYWAEFTKDDDNARMNMQRNGKDFLMLNLIAGLSILLSKIADDEENKDVFAIQAVNYLMLRLTNETASVGVALPATYYEVVESSFVGLNVIPDVLSVGDIGNDELVTSGKWYGATKNLRYWGRNTGLIKSYFDLKNVQRVKDSYVRNSGTFMYFTPAYLLSESKDEKEN